MHAAFEENCLIKVVWLYHVSIVNEAEAEENQRRLDEQGIGFCVALCKQIDVIATGICELLDIFDGASRTLYFNTLRSVCTTRVHGPFIRVVHTDL
jgi:hypothetical protein